MALCLTADTHYLNQCWPITGEVLWYSPAGNFTGNVQDLNHQIYCKITHRKLPPFHSGDAITIGTNEVTCHSCDRWIRNFVDLYFYNLSSLNINLVHLPPKSRHQIFPWTQSYSMSLSTQISCELKYLLINQSNKQFPEHSNPYTTFWPYRNVTWAPCCPRSPAIQMFTQQFVRANIKET